MKKRFKEKLQTGDYYIHYVELLKDKHLSDRILIGDKRPNEVYTVNHYGFKVYRGDNNTMRLDRVHNEPKEVNLIAGYVKFIDGWE